MTEIHNSPVTATQAPMAVYGDSVDGATAPLSESVDIPPRGTHQPTGDGPEVGPSALFLKPCPFFGGEPVQVMSCDDADTEYPFSVECEECAVSTDLYMDDEGAVEAWNRRHHTKSPKKKRDAAEKVDAA